MQKLFVPIKVNGTTVGKIEWLGVYGEEKLTGYDLAAVQITQIHSFEGDRFDVSLELFGVQPRRLMDGITPHKGMGPLVILTDDDGFYRAISLVELEGVNPEDKQAVLELLQIEATKFETK